MTRRVVVCAILFSAALLENASAHDPGLSSAAVSISDQAVDAMVTFNQRDLEALPAFSQGQPGQIAPALLKIRIGEVSLPLESATIGQPQPNNIAFQLHWKRSGTGPLQLSSGVIEQLPFGHRQLISVTTPQGASLGQRLISGRDNGITVVIGSVAVPQSSEGFTEFFLLGVRHILTGYDHLLFLLGILIVCRGFGEAARIITCFTIAHSITLALATFTIVAIPSRVVEPMIAASIVYVALENLWRRDTLRWREVLTFSFGLIHGLGFASALREMGVGSTTAGVVIPLFSFNVGVECGQLAVGACILPIALKLRMGRNFERIAVPAVSMVVALTGAYWLIERVVRT